MFTGQALTRVLRIARKTVLNVRRVAKFAIECQLLRFEKFIHVKVALITLQEILGICLFFILGFVFWLGNLYSIKCLTLATSTISAWHRSSKLITGRAERTEWELTNREV